MVLCCCEACIRISPSVVSTRQKDVPSRRHYQFMPLCVCRPGGGARALMMTALSKQTYSHLNYRFHRTAACKPSPLNRLSCRTFLQTVYKPSTNRPTNRARRLGNPYKPYKPYTRGAYFPTPQIVTVCTVCRNSLGTVHGL